MSSHNSSNKKTEIKAIPLFHMEIIVDFPQR